MTTYQTALTEARAAAQGAEAIDTLTNGRVLYGFKAMPLTFVVADAMASLDDIAEALIEQAFIQLAQARRAAQLMETVGGKQ